MVLRLTVTLVLVLFWKLHAGTGVILDHLTETLCFSYHLPFLFNAYRLIQKALSR